MAVQKKMANFPWATTPMGFAQPEIYVHTIYLFGPHWLHSNWFLNTYLHLIICCWWFLCKIRPGFLPVSLSVCLHLNLKVSASAGDTFHLITFPSPNGWANTAYGNRNESPSKRLPKLGHSQQVGTIQKSLMFFKCAALMEPLICKCLHFAAITRKNLSDPVGDSSPPFGSPHTSCSRVCGRQIRVCKPGHAYIWWCLCRKQANWCGCNQKTEKRRQMAQKKWERRRLRKKKRT